MIDAFPGARPMPEEVAAGAVAVALEVEEGRRPAVEEVLAHAGGRIQQIA